QYIRFKNNLFISFNYVLLIFCTSCQKNLKQIKFYENIEYKLDDFFVIDFKENIYNDDAYIGVSNDSVYLLENYDNECYMKWALGYLGSNEKRIISLNNNCQTSPITDHLFSQTEGIDFNNTDFMFKIDLGTNGDLNTKDIRRILMFSKEKGVICLI